LSVRKAIKAAQSLLKTVKKVPATGLALFSGEGESEIVVPPLPIPTNSYLCDKRFHTEVIADLFEEHDTYGYLAVTDVVLLFTVTGTRTTILFKMQTDLPTNTRRGGQSANRIARIRAEKRDMYRSKIVDAVVTKGQKIKGLIISGHGDRPREIRELLTSDSRWRIPVLGTVKIGDRDVVTETVDKGQALIAYSNRDDEKKHILYIEEMMRTDVDRLVFGRSNIYVAEEKLETVYASQKEDGLNCDVIILSETGYLNQFNGIIGILYRGNKIENFDSV
jgi:peptide subunit release factor 1 (eRF1)